MVVGLVCYSLQVPPPVQGPLTGGAVGIPAAIDYQLQARRRDKREDIARIQRNELRRPLGLVVAMFAVVLFLVEQMGLLGAALLTPPSFEVLSPWSLAWLVAYCVAMIADFFIASYASHYLGKRPYLWAVVAVVFSYALQLLLLLATRMGIGWHERFDSVFHVISGLGYLGSLGACLAGVRHGRRHHHAFLAKKLARIQPKVSQLPPPPPPPPPGPDLLEQLKKLAELRDAGVLTDDEFQAKKAEILARL